MPVAGHPPHTTVHASAIALIQRRGVGLRLNKDEEDRPIKTSDSGAHWRSTLGIHTSVDCVLNILGRHTTRVWLDLSIAALERANASKTALDPIKPYDEPSSRDVPHAKMYLPEHLRLSVFE
jgi:hypothetical protein